jgi:D-alanyl-D-alanine carboxypeptidase
MTMTRRDDQRRRSARSATGRARRLAAALGAFAMTSLLVVTVGPLATDASPGRAPRATAPACTFDDVITPRSDEDDWATTILDTALRLPHGYRPSGLVPVSRAGLGGSGKVRDLVIEDLAALVDAAADAGAHLRSVSAYRSEHKQAEVFAAWEADRGRDSALAGSARPGHSEHLLGTAIDFGSAAGAEPWTGDWGSSTEGRWMAGNAWRFGFVRSYPVGASPGQTCYQPESWHYRYVGRDEAAAVHDAGVSLREYLWRIGAGR